jgi:hypothetical protein
MKTTDFISKYASTLSEKSLDWLTALQDETLSDIWENTNDPLFLIEVLKCLLNPNYDTALNEYLRDALLLYAPLCNDEYIFTLSNTIRTLNQFIDGKLVGAAQFADANYLMNKEVRPMLQNSQEETAAGRAIIYAASFSIGWLFKESDIASILAAHHATEHLIRTFDQGQEDLSDILRMYVGNPFS